MEKTDGFLGTHVLHTPPDMSQSKNFFFTREIFSPSTKMPSAITHLTPLSLDELDALSTFGQKLITLSRTATEHASRFNALCEQGTASDTMFEMMKFMLDECEYLNNEYITLMNRLVSTDTASLLETELSTLVTFVDPCDLSDIENTLESLHDTAFKAYKHLDDTHHRHWFRTWFNSNLNDAYEKHCQALDPNVEKHTELNSTTLEFHYNNARLGDVITAEEEYDELVELYRNYIDEHKDTTDLEPLFSCRECGRKEPTIELPPAYNGMYHLSISDGCETCQDVDIDEIRRSGVPSLSYVGTTL